MSLSKGLYVILVATFLVLACAYLLVMIPRAIRNAKRTGCASNLRSLWQSQFNYAAQYGRHQGDLPAETGTAFFLRLQRTPKPLIDRYEPFICPYTGEVPGPGKCSYRGPAINANKLGLEDPCAADKEGNHGPGQGGTVLTKTGDCKEVEASDPLWIRARTTTKE